MLRWLLHGNSLLLLRRTCSLENAHLSCLWLQRNTDTETLQSLDQMSLEPFRMKLIEVVATKFFIGATVTLKVIADDQQAMSYCDERSFTPSSSGESFELGGEVTVLRPDRCPRGLAGHAAQPWTAFAALAAEPLARALMVTWT